MVLPINILSKSYRKLFRPNGIVLGDAREYIPGDDAKFINWNITAKTGTAFVDSIQLDSSNDIIFALDISESMKFGTRTQTKLTLASNIIHGISHLAEIHCDQVGLALFSSGLEKFLSPRRNTKIFKYAIENATSTGEKLQTNLDILKTLHKIIKKKSTIIIICDTFCLSKNRKATLAQMHKLATKHDIILLLVVDDGEMPHPCAGKIRLEDMETGETIEINTNDTVLMSKIRTKYDAYQSLILREINSLGIKVLMANTSTPSEEFLFTFLA
ncbi:MAG: DUF58 domain-containing protein [Puniceicoccales bacterium]|jgi:uncharacterized protein (DUF58 family)|nr:DUF58 domain-containing protein [Puniceicoccales bacterium]